MEVVGGDAYTYLETAFDSATVDVQIWIAKGIYKPDNSRSDVFGLSNVTSARARGGVTGFEESQRSTTWYLNETILSGDIGITEYKEDNSHGIWEIYDIGGAVELNGLIIEDERSDGDGARSVFVDGIGDFTRSRLINGCVGPRLSENGCAAKREADISAVIWRCSATKAQAFAASRSPQPFMRWLL
ncbi:MAG: hypothetical protein GF344_06985 [Chitinivibrionales bacterium]|nr:hypothetical protein [Chitinivibrionales bacterium]